MGPPDRSRPPRRPSPRPKAGSSPAAEGELKIVGGELRGRRIRYSGDTRTRPMKHATREAIFNLVGGWMPGRLAIDLFAGTGAVGIEALSRGAVAAKFIERHHPTARIIRDNLQALGIDSKASVESADALFWMRHWLQAPERTDIPWIVFICPPYELFRTQREPLQTILEGTLARAPEGSVVVVEAPETIDPEWFPDPESWRLRHYSPATVAVWRPGAEPAYFDDDASQPE